MKIIDEKGRLFGKINIIDFLVLLFLFCLLPVGYVGYKILTEKDQRQQEREFVKVEVKCQLIKLKPEVLELIAVGDKELDENKEVIGEIIGLGKVSPYRYEFDIAEGQKIVKEDSNLKQVEARLNLTAEVKQGVLYYKDMPIKIGEPLEFNTEKYGHISVVLAKTEVIEEIEDMVADLPISLKDLGEDVLKEISVGDKELDKNGKTIAEILRLGKIEDSAFDVNLGSGQYTVGNGSARKQISAMVRLKCQLKSDNQLYFKERKLQGDTPIELKTDKYKVTGFLEKSFKEEEAIQEREIDLYVVLKDLNEEVIREIAVGDKELGKDGWTIAEILSLGKIEDSAFEFNLGEGSFVIGKDRSKKQISAMMRLKCAVKNDNQLYFKGRKVEHASPLEFTTDKYKIKGLPSQAYRKQKWMKLQVKFNGLATEIASAVQQGDIEKSPSGEVEARIESIISNKPSQVLAIEQGEFITLQHPFDRSLVLTLSVRCIENEGIYYFKNYPVKIGNNIVFTAELYSMSGEIVGMEMK